MKISVCLATYNGGKFLGMQLDSILSQLKQEDEVVIIDDASSDNTVEVIKSYRDSRVRLYRNEQNQGVNYSFGRAISMATGEYLFLSDQDDVWPSGRAETMLNALQKDGAWLLSSNFTAIDIKGNDFAGYANEVKAVDSRKYLKNILDIYLGKLNYFGCTMVFNAKLKKVILPFPSYLESHDLWMALAANLTHSNLHLEAITLFHRVHGNNVSIVKRPLCKKIWSRVIFSVSLIHLSERIICNAFKRKIK